MITVKPVRAEQVRRPERSQVPGPGSVSLTLTEKNRPRLSKSGPRTDIGGPEHHTPLYFFVFICFDRIFRIFFNFMAKRPSRELVLSYRSPRPWFGVGIPVGSDAAYRQFTFPSVVVVLQVKTNARDDHLRSLDFASSLPRTVFSLYSDLITTCLFLVIFYL